MIHDLKYGQLRHAIRQVLTREQKRRVTIALRREGFTFLQRQKITLLLAAAMAGAAEGVTEAVREHHQ